MEKQMRNIYIYFILLTIYNYIKTKLVGHNLIILALNDPDENTCNSNLILTFTLLLL